MEIETKIDISPNDIWDMIEGEVDSAIGYAIDSAIGDLDLSDQIAEGIDDYDFSDIIDDVVEASLEGRSLTIGSSTEKVDRLKIQVDAIQRSVVGIIDALQKHFEQERDALKEKLSDL